MKTMNHLRKLAGVSMLALAGLTTANIASADTWRYAHEEYEGDVQDVFAYKFKEYIEDPDKLLLEL